MVPSLRWEGPGGVLLAASMSFKSICCKDDFVHVPLPL